MSVDIFSCHTGEAAPGMQWIEARMVPNILQSAEQPPIAELFGPKCQ